MASHRKSLAPTVLAVFNELKLENPRPRFTVGIFDDVTGLSLPLSDELLPQRTRLEALFYGLGSDGTVSATKNNIKIIGNSTRCLPKAILFTTPRKPVG